MLSISKDVLTQELAGETVILDLASESYFGLDEVGTRIWQLLEKGKDESEMAGILAGEYDVGREVLERDIGELLERLTEAGLISRA